MYASLLSKENTSIFISRTNLATLQEGVVDVSEPVVLYFNLTFTLQSNKFTIKKSKGS